MSRRFRYLVWMLFLPALLVGQNLDSDVVRIWVANQTKGLNRLQQVAWYEETVRTAEWPGRSRRVEETHRVSGNPSKDKWERRIVKATVDGKPIPQSREDVLDRHRDSPAGRRMEVPWQSPMLSKERLQQIKVRGNGSLEEVDGVMLRRFEAEYAREGRRNPDQITLWFTAEKPRLVRTTVSFRAGRDNSPGSLTTQYHRRKGVDVPATRVMDTLMRTRRRERDLTTRVRVVTTYRDYHLDNRP